MNVEITIKENEVMKKGADKPRTEKVVTILSGLTIGVLRQLQGKQSAEVKEKIGFQLGQVAGVVQAYLSDGYTVITTSEDAGVMIGATPMLSNPDLLGELIVIGTQGDETTSNMFVTLKPLMNVRWIEMSEIVTNKEDYAEVEERLKANREEITAIRKDIKFAKKNRVDPGEIVELEIRLIELQQYRNKLGKLYTDKEITNIAQSLLATELSKNLVIIKTLRTLETPERFSIIHAIRNEYTTSMMIDILDMENPVSLFDINGIKDISSLIVNANEERWAHLIPEEIEVPFKHLKELVADNKHISRKRKVTIKPTLPKAFLDELAKVSASNRGDFRSEPIYVVNNPEADVQSLLTTKVSRLILTQGEDKAEEDLDLPAFTELLGSRTLEEATREIIGATTEEFIVTTYLTGEDTELPTRILLEQIEDEFIVFLSDRYKGNLLEELKDHPKAIVINPRFYQTVLGTTENHEGDIIVNRFNRARSEDFIVSKLNQQFIQIVTGSANVRLEDFFKLQDKTTMRLKQSKDLGIFQPDNSGKDIQDLLEKAKEEQTQGYYSNPVFFRKASEVITDTMVWDKLKAGSVSEEIEQINK